METCEVRTKFVDDGSASARDAAATVRTTSEEPAAMPRRGQDLLGPGSGTPVVIDLWLVDLQAGEAETQRLSGICSREEREKAATFLHSADSRRTLVCRGRLREILAHYVGAPPNGLTIGVGRRGKPFLAEPGSIKCRNRQPFFNVSHCGEKAAIAISLQQDVGVDIEMPRHVEPEIATLYFAAAEVEALSRLSGAAWRLGFFRCWTRKEAFLKLLGCGLARTLDSFSVPIDADGEALSVSCGAASASRWRLQSFEDGTGLIGAVCVESGARPVVVRRYFA